MSQATAIRCYEYVNRPYDQVRGLLHRNPLELLRRATTSAAARSNDLAGSLRIELGGIELGVKVTIHVHSVQDGAGVAGLSPVTRVAIGWEATHAPSLFPLMSGQLSAWPLTASETQVELEAKYTPPLGALGIAIDAAVGHRIAEASVRRFVEDVIQYIRDELPATT
jgi:hypothetical protein